MLLSVLCHDALLEVAVVIYVFRTYLRSGMQYTHVKRLSRKRY